MQKLFDVTVTIAIEAESAEEAANAFIFKLAAKREVQATVRECITPTRSGSIHRCAIKFSNVEGEIYDRS